MITRSGEGGRKCGRLASRGARGAAGVTLGSCSLPPPSARASAPGLGDSPVRTRPFIVRTVSAPAGLRGLGSLGALPPRPQSLPGALSAGTSRPRAWWGGRRRGAQPPEQRDSGPVTHEIYGRRAGGRGCRFRLDVRKGAPYGMPPTALRGRGGLAPPSTGFPHTPFECLNDVIPHYPGRALHSSAAGRGGASTPSAGCKFKIGASTGRVLLTA